MVQLAQVFESAVQALGAQQMAHQDFDGGPMERVLRREKEIKGEVCAVCR